MGSGDLVAAGCAALDSPAALEGMRAKITIDEGEVICMTAIEPRPPVARGDEVTVRYVAGPVMLTTRAVAQADGLVGKTVLVRNTGSGDFFRATVSGKAEVRVDE
jgi:flagella basal body P-ring formation protein FlgA